jgi:superoxide dismutase, Cu-Zn family
MKPGIIACCLVVASLPLVACNDGRQADTRAIATDTPGIGTAPATAPATGLGAAQTVEVELQNRDGQVIGTAQISEEGEGVRIAIQASNLPPGPKGFHFHETGQCDPPGFQTAGGHFAPMDRQHGLENPQGPHAGDMPNLTVGPDGRADTTIVNPRVTLREGQPNSLIDQDGTALIIHAERDDQVTDPTGNSGDRIACGVVRRN